MRAKLSNTNTMSKESEIKYYTEQGMEYEPMLGVGDLIEFDWFGELKKGKIITVGKYGYWINSTSLYNGSIRCPFGKEIAYT